VPYHEIALHELKLARETLLDSILRRTLNLVIVVVETSNVGISELGNLSGRTTDTAPNIEHLHAGLDTDIHGQKVLMASNSLVKSLAGGVAAEVEGLAPAIFVQIGREIVVTVGVWESALVGFDRSQELGAKCPYGRQLTALSE